MRSRLESYTQDMRRHEAAYDPEKRAAEKQASRLEDAHALTSGEKSREQLRRENSMFAGAASIVLGKPDRLY